VIPKLLTKLKTIATIDNRVYALVAPAQTTLPYLTYRTLNQERDYTHQGYSDYKTDSIRITCFGATYGQSKALAIEVKELLEAWDNEGVQAVFIYSEIDIYNEADKIYATDIGVTISNNND